MGGCRCTYKNCASSTKTSDNQHFFHYPVKQRERCIVWIRNAGRQDFLELPNDQLRNKVLCENHFEDKYFTNSHRRRLVHDAIPTLDAGCAMETNDVKEMNVYPTSIDGSTFTLQAPGATCNVEQRLSKGSNLIYEQDAPATEVYTIDPKYIEQQPFYNLNQNNDDDNLIIYKTSCCSSICNKTGLEESRDDEELVNRNELFSNDSILPENPVVIPTVKVEENPPPAIIAQHKKRKAIMPPNVMKKINNNAQEIANIKRVLICSKRKKINKSNILSKLKGRIPETLFGALSMHLFQKRSNFTHEEKGFLHMLHSISPSAYNTINDFGWHIPKHRIVNGSISTGI